MIINLIEDKANQIKISYKDQGTDSLTNQSFSTKSYSDILSWGVYNQKIDEITFTVISNSLCFLKDINYRLPNFIDTINYKIETSIDYINWYELPYKDENGYIFKNTDLYGNVTYLYDKYEFQIIKFTFTGLSDLFDFTSRNVLKFIELEILIDEEFNSSYIKKKLLSTKSTIFTKSKIYDEYPFIADMITNFMQMLEQNNNLGLSNEYKNTYLQKTTFGINHIIKL